MAWQRVGPGLFLRRHLGLRLSRLAAACLSLVYAVFRACRDTPGARLRADAPVYMAWFGVTCCGYPRRGDDCRADLCHFGGLRAYPNDGTSRRGDRHARELVDRGPQSQDHAALGELD